MGVVPPSSPNKVKPLTMTYIKSFGLENRSFKDGVAVSWGPSDYLAPALAIAPR